MFVSTIPNEDFLARYFCYFSESFHFHLLAPVLRLQECEITLASKEWSHSAQNRKEDCPKPY